MWKEQEKKPIIPYLLLTFGISWSAELLCILIERLQLLPSNLEQLIVMSIIAIFGAFAPGMAVYILLKKHGKITDMKGYIKRVFACENKKNLLLGIIISFAIFGLLIIATEETNPEYPFYLILPIFIVMIPGGGWEELGWRGFLQTALEERFGFIRGTALLGVIWSVWHLPLWLIQCANQKDFVFWAFAVYCIAFSFLLAMTYQITQCVLAPILLHAWGNTMCGGVFTYHVLENGPSILGWILLAGMIVLACIVNQVHQHQS